MQFLFNKLLSPFKVLAFKLKTCYNFCSMACPAILSMCMSNSCCVLRPQLHWNVLVASDVIWNKFHATNWLTEKGKKEFQWDAWNLFQMTSDATYTFPCNRGLKVFKFGRKHRISSFFGRKNNQPLSTWFRLCLPCYQEKYTSELKKYIFSCSSGGQKIWSAQIFGPLGKQQICCNFSNMNCRF